MLFDVPSGVAGVSIRGQGRHGSRHRHGGCGRVGASLSKSRWLWPSSCWSWGTGRSGSLRDSRTSARSSHQQRGRAYPWWAESIVWIVPRSHSRRFPGQVLRPRVGVLRPGAMGLAASTLMFIVVRQGSGAEDLTGHGIGGRLAATVVEHRDVFLTAGVRDRLAGSASGPSGLLAPVGRRDRSRRRPDRPRVRNLVFVDAGLFYPSGYIMDRWGRNGQACQVCSRWRSGS